MFFSSNTLNKGNVLYDTEAAALSGHAVLETLEFRRQLYHFDWPLENRIVVFIPLMDTKGTFYIPLHLLVIDSELEKKFFDVMKGNGTKWWKSFIETSAGTDSTTTEEVSVQNNKDLKEMERLNYELLRYIRSKYAFVIDNSVEFIEKHVISMNYKAGDLIFMRADLLHAGPGIDKLGQERILIFLLLTLSSYKKVGQEDFQGNPQFLKLILQELEEDSEAFEQKWISSGRISKEEFNQYIS